MRRLIPYLVVLLTFGALIVVAQLSQLEAHHGSCATDAETCDVDYSGYVDSVDVGLVRSRFGIVFGTATPVPILSATATSVPTSTHTPAPPTATASPSPLTPTPTAGAGACWPTDIALGALPGQPLPVFCSLSGTAADTHTAGANSWADTFDQPANLTHLSPAYRQYADIFGSVNQTAWWQHATHLMLDINGVDQTPDNGPWDFGGAAIRPDRSFAFGSQIVIDQVMASGVDEYGGQAWTELVLTTCSAPTGPRDATTALYIYDTFRGCPTVGCRFYTGGHPVCALFDASNCGAGCGGRIWEISVFQHAGTSTTTGPLARQCFGTDPDTNCRDLHRLTITSGGTLRVEIGPDEAGLTLHFEQTGLPRLDQFAGRDVYVYVGAVIFKPWSTLGKRTTRWHFDALRVNP